MGLEGCFRRMRHDRRTPLTRDRVLRAAISLVDADGIDALSMRKLGRALGVEAMSLYNHVARKEDILDGIADHVLKQIDLPTAGCDWESAIWKCAVSAHEILSAHPWACNLIMSIPRPLPSRLQYMDSVLRCLREAGFSQSATYHGYHALDSHILGFTLWEAGHVIKADEIAGLAALLPQLTAAGYPDLADHAARHLAGIGRDEEGEFEFGLRLIVDGLKRTRDHLGVG